MSEERAQTRQPAARGEAPREAPPLLDRARAAEELRRFLDLALREMHLAAQYELSSASEAAAPQEEQITVLFTGADEDLLLQHNADLLLALEHVAHRWLRLDPRLHDRVRFDCAGYRAARLDELKLSARVAAQRVRETGQAFHFNPMPPRERRAIHLELNGAPGVRTVSEGPGDRRHLVIYPAPKQ